MYPKCPISLVYPVSPVSPIGSIGFVGFTRLTGLVPLICHIFALFLLKIRQNPYKKASFSRFFKKKIEISCKFSEICLYLHQICGSVKEKQRADMAFTGLIRHEI